MQRIIGLSIIGIVITFFNLQYNLCNAETHKIIKGGYHFTVSKESERFENHIMNDSQLPCRTYQKEISFSKRERVIFSDLESYTQEIESVFGVNLSAGSGQAIVNAKFELKNTLLKNTAVEKSDEYNAEIKCRMVLDSLKCFNQEAIIVYKVTKYAVKGVKKRAILKDKKMNFSFTDKIFSHLLKRYTYEENCSNECKIRDKTVPVLGLDGKQIHAVIKYENKGIYILPLYWASDRKIISPFPLLPKNVQDHVASILPKTKESAFYSSRLLYDP